MQATRPIKQSNKFPRRTKPVRVDRKPVKTAAKVIAQSEGQRGVDSRSDSIRVETAYDNSLVVPNTDRTIDAVATTNVQAVYNMAIGIVLAAIKKGWVATLGTDEYDYVYQAYCYLIRAYFTSMLGGQLALQVAPLWFWHSAQALAPKTLPFKTGDITYKWRFDQDPTLAVPPPVSTFDDTDVSLGYVDYSQIPVNGFYPISTSSYDPVRGELAVKSLFNVFKTGGMNTLVPFTLTGMDKDSSSFSATYPEFGYGAGTDTGAASTSYSERQITHPIFAKFALYQPENFRGWAQVERTGGTPCYILPKMAEMATPVALKNHVPPIFKFYDMDEFYEVLSLTMGKALELQSRENVSTSAGSCPLTPQQVQILLRQTLISQFNNEMAQDLGWDGNNTAPAIVFSVGVNGNSQITTPMRLPQFLCENIRACARKIVKLGKGSVSQLDLIPLLGRGRGPLLGNYTWGESSALVYTDPATVSPPEIPINLVNCSYVSGSTTIYLDLNGQELGNYATLWNEWITSLSSYLTPLAAPGAERGISALSTITTTRSCRSNPFPDANSAFVAGIATQKRLGKQLSVKELGSRCPIKTKARAAPIPGQSDIFALRQVNCITTTNIPLAPVFKYLSLMVLPVFLADAGMDLSATLAMRQVFQIEPYSVAAGSAAYTSILSNGALDQLSVHQAMASLDVKSALSSMAEVTINLSELAKQGRGGLFTSLAGMFAEDVLGIKGGKQIASAIGGAIGI